MTTSSVIVFSKEEETADQRETVLDFQAVHKQHNRVRTAVARARSQIGWCFGAGWLRARHFRSEAECGFPDRRGRLSHHPSFLHELWGWQERVEGNREMGGRERE